MLTTEEREKVKYYWTILTMSGGDVTVLTPEELRELRSLVAKWLQQENHPEPNQTSGFGAPGEKEYIVYFYDGSVRRMPGPLKELQKLPVKRIEPAPPRGVVTGERRPWLPVPDPLGIVERATRGAPIQLKDPIRRILKGSSNLQEQVDYAAGTCYEDAWRFLSRQKEGWLVHGKAQGKNHAWVETEMGYVWEPQSQQFYKKEDFLKKYEAQEVARYDWEKAALMAARTGNYGPWGM